MSTESSNSQLVLLPSRDALQLLNPHAVVEIILASAREKRADILARSEAIEQVAGESSQKAAHALLKEIQELLNAVERERKVVKSPFLAAGNRVDVASDEYTKALDGEKVRLKLLLGRFQQEQQRKAQEAQRAQDAELRRLAQEREQAEKAGKEEEVLAADLKAAEVVTAPPPAVVAKSEGMVVRYKHVVVVNDPVALFKVFPDLITLTPKLREINAVVTRMAGEQPETLPQLPGCTITKEIDVR